MNQKIATEERLLLKTQRKLEAIHLLGELFTRIKVNLQPFSIIIFGLLIYKLILYFSQKLILKVMRMKSLKKIMPIQM